MGRRFMMPLLAAFAFCLAPMEAGAVNITTQTESQPFPGVTIVEGQTTSPTTRFYAAYISLCHDHVHVDASQTHSLQTSGQWASSQGAQVAVNGDFYAWTDATLHVYGDAVGGGVRWPSIRTGRDDAYSSSWFYQRYGWIAFGDDFVEYSNTKWIKDRWEDYGADQGWRPKSVTQAIPDGTQALISGFPQLVVEGQAIQCSSPTASSCFPDRGDMRDRHPRTAMGLTEDRNTFILVVVDGRQTGLAGMYGTELADLMHQLGAHVAFNLDGGGSSQMWVQGQGTINSPSSNPLRTVPNSWGIFAGAAGGMPRLPGSCDRTFDELLYQMHLRDHGGHSDINGNGLADVCIRGPEGMECFLADGDGGFTEPVEGPPLRDSSGWGDPTNHGTIRMGDVTGNGMADICARANARVYCWLSSGDGFAERIDGPALSNAEGFDDIRYFSTIRLADVTGDGRADLCVRTPEDFRCYPSTGDGFGDPIIGPALADASGWGVPWHYGTIRMGDITGDGRADLCARRNAGFACWPSTGDGFGSRIDGPAWSNAEGWRDIKYWSTIELVDIDGDGLADVCARGPDGISCHLSTGSGFGPQITGPELSDSSGWSDYANYSTIRFADIMGDGTRALCARANAGIRCWPWDGAGFSSPVTAGMADGSGWFRERYFRTIRFADVTGDGRDDLCARASAGLVCWPSTGDGFADDLVLGPQWSDAEGFDDPNYYSTLRLATSLPCRGEFCGDDGEDEQNGDDVGPDAGLSNGNNNGDTGIEDPQSPADTGYGSDVEGASAGPSSTSTSSCACATFGATPSETTGTLFLLLIGLAFLRRKKE